MKKIKAEAEKIIAIIKDPINGTIQTITSISKDTFETEDGKIFYYDKDAIEYEKKLKYVK